MTETQETETQETETQDTEAQKAEAMPANQRGLQRLRQMFDAQWEAHRGRRR